MTRYHTATPLLLACLLVVGCGGSKEAPPQSTNSTNVTAELSGSASGRVTGSGVLTYFPASASVVGERPGFWFIADGTGERPLGLTIVVPDNTEPGDYELTSPHPMEMGTKFELRVDQTKGNRVVSYNKNTSGTLTLDSFPKDHESLSETEVMGRFSFSTENTDGDVVSGTGSFQFTKSNQ